jgi:hypothetical protein
LRRRHCHTGRNSIPAPKRLILGCNRSEREDEIGGETSYRKWWRRFPQPRQCADPLSAWLVVEKSPSSQAPLEPEAPSTRHLLSAESHPPNSGHRDAVWARNRGGGLDHPRSARNLNQTPSTRLGIDGGGPRVALGYGLGTEERHRSYRGRSGVSCARSTQIARVRSGCASRVSWPKKETEGATDSGTTGCSWGSHRPDSVRRERHGRTGDVCGMSKQHPAQRQSAWPCSPRPTCH